MIELEHYEIIFNSIITFIAINVMYVFIRQQFSAKMMLHYFST
jgi:hypothetical protein